jgi:hypothetical protein
MSGAVVLLGALVTSGRLSSRVCGEARVTCARACDLVCDGDARCGLFAAQAPVPEAGSGAAVLAVGSVHSFMQQRVAGRPYAQLLHVQL